MHSTARLSMQARAATAMGAPALAKPPRSHAVRSSRVPCCHSRLPRQPRMPHSVGAPSPHAAAALRVHRARVRETISGQDLIEVYVAAPYEVCARRDTKGLYSKAALGLIVNFTGKDSAFEAPFAGEVSIIVPTEVESAAESSARLYLYVKANLGDVA